MLPPTQSKKRVAINLVPKVRENRLFLGNSGTGKSTLINCLVGQPILPSGMNSGVGVTKVLDGFVHKDVLYMDTPGLTDAASATQAAAAIETALKQGGKYKLFFVMRLKNGHVDSEDMAVMELVLSAIAIDATKLRYSIIFNNVDNAQYARLTRPGSHECDSVKRLVNARRFKTSSFCFIPSVPVLNGKANAIAKLPSHVSTFIHDLAPLMKIDPRTIRTIDPTEFVRHAELIDQEMDKWMKERTSLTTRHSKRRQVDARSQRQGHPPYTPREADYAALPEGSPNDGAFDHEPTMLGWSRKTVIIGVIVLLAIVLVGVISFVATRGRSKGGAAVSVQVGAVQVGCVSEDVFDVSVSLETLTKPISLNDLVAVATYHSQKYIVARGNSSTTTFSVVAFNASLSTALQNELQDCSSIAGDQYVIYRVNNVSTPSATSSPTMNDAHTPIDIAVNQTRNSGNTTSASTNTNASTTEPPVLGHLGV